MPEAQLAIDPILDAGPLKLEDIPCVEWGIPSSVSLLSDREGEVTAACLLTALGLIRFTNRSRGSRLSGLTPLISLANKSSSCTDLLSRR